MDITALEHAWREYAERTISRQYHPDMGQMLLEPSRNSFLAGYAAGAGYALSAVKKLAGEKSLTEMRLARAAQHGEGPAAPTGEDS